MKLTITLGAGDKKPLFRPGDKVRGELEIRDCVSKQIKSITATFRGRVRAVVIPRNNAPPEYGMHTFFEESQPMKTELSNGASAVQPTSDNRNGRPEPDHSTSFEFTFPGTSRYCPCQLPPTLHMASPSVKVRVEYSIVAAVRYRLCRLMRTKTVQRDISFRPGPGAIFLPPPTVDCILASSLRPTMKRASPEIDASCLMNLDPLPLYTASVQVEVKLPSPPILTTGQETPIRLVLHIPPEALQCGDIYLRSVVIQLRSSAAAVVGRVSGGCAETAHLWSSQGRVHIDKERFELDSGAWGNCIVLEGRPTCTSCVLDLTHAVEVIAGISSGEGEEIQFVRSSLSVLVMNPPPSYVCIRSGAPASG